MSETKTKMRVLAAGELEQARAEKWAARDAEDRKMLVRGIERLRWEGLYLGTDCEDHSPCGDCRAEVGDHHRLGCDLERCPVCSGQLLSCGCRVSNEPPSVKRHRASVRSLLRFQAQHGRRPKQ